MANLKAIRRRISSVQNTQKITRAMKMVAAARLRKAQDAVESFRDYAELTSAILGEVAAGSSEDDHELLQRRPTEKRLVLLFSSDRGLCGAFNSNLFRVVESLAREEEADTVLSHVGRKGRDYFSVRETPTEFVYDGVYDDVSYDTASRIARELSAKYVSGEVDRIDMAFNEFVSVASQKPVVRQLLPVELTDREGPGDDDGDNDDLGPVGLIYEPDRASLLGALLPRYVEVQVYRALVETVAAEHAARMSAMDSATNNAADMIENLTLVYNRARQSAITSELMDIVGGAEALND
jgi:F-type H+-transporting ATPase subunit gamma